MRTLFAVLLMCMVARAAEPLHCPDVSVLQVTKGEYESRPGVVFTLENYAARMVPRSKQMPECFSKINLVEHGRIEVSDASLSKLFEQKLEKGHNSKISGLKVHAQEGQIVISGTAHKGLPIPFSIEGPVDSPDGHLIRLRAKKVKAAGIPIKGLLNMVGVELGSLLHPAGTKAVKVDGDAITFDPEELGNVRGHIEKVEVAGENMVVDFGAVRTPRLQAKQTRPGK